MDGHNSAGVPCRENKDAWWHDVINYMQMEAQRNAATQTVALGSPEHEQRLTESPWGPIMVDAGMVTILKALWA